MSSIYQFELLDSLDVVVGGGWILAPSPSAALRSAELLLGGTSNVRLASGARHE